VSAGIPIPRTPGAVLAGVALVLAALAPVVGAEERPGRPGVAELSDELAAGAPFVDAVALAEWIRSGRPLRVRDVRDSSAFVRFSIPTAEHAPVGRIADEPIDSTRPLVLYADGTGEAVRAWLLLRRLGHRPHILERGILGWIDGVISPVLPAGTSDERDRYSRVAEVSRYFGGMPRIGQPPAPASDAGEAVRLLTRRGCY
jgi:rhodanese-related sulfurtransferase